MHTSSRGDGWAPEKDIVLSVGLTNQTPNKWVQIAPKQRPAGTGIGKLDVPHDFTNDARSGCLIKLWFILMVFGIEMKHGWWHSRRCCLRVGLSFEVI